MKCGICGREDAVLRPCELPVAAVTGRGHVDCRGHGEYRHLSVVELVGIRGEVQEGGE